MPKKTYAQARKEIFQYLKSLDWDLSLPSLKVPYATSPDGTIRLWFKPQAVYFTQSNRGSHQFSNARTFSYDFDYRSMSPANFVNVVVDSIEGRSSNNPSKNPSKRPPAKKKAETIKPTFPSTRGIVAQRGQLRSAIREKRKEVIPKLRIAVKQAKQQRAARLRKCKADCKQAERRARKAATVARKKLELYIRRAKQKASEVCKSCKVIDDKAIDALQKSVEQLNTEMAEVKRLRAQAGALRSERGRAGGRRSAELRSESDSQVIHNLGDDEEMIALFKKVRGKIKATPYMSRTEAFFEWLHNNPEALDEFRSVRERKWEKEAERLYAEREPPSCSDELADCRRELNELKAAERFLADEDVPF